MKKQTHQKKPKLTHDSLFKLFYSNKELFKELLKLILSKKELEALDLNSLELEKDSFEERKFADLIFSISFKDKSKAKLQVFIILEHKSHYDRKAYTQLLDYQVFLRKQSIQQVNYARPIIPMFFYHGEKPLKWKKSLQEEDFGSYFSKIPMDMRKSMLNYEPRIIV